jgi:hypothetical protein
MDHANHTRELEKSLQALATCLQSPIVPGEMVEWLAMVRKGIDTVEPLLKRNFETVHKSEYEQIEEEDRGLSHRVDALRNGDEESLKLVQSLRKCLDEVAEKAKRKEPDELAVQDDIGRCTEQGLEFVNHAQKQEVGRKTWLQEAFNRVRGGGD